MNGVVYVVTNNWWLACKRNLHNHLKSPAGWSYKIRRDWIYRRVKIGNTLENQWFPLRNMFKPWLLHILRSCDRWKPLSLQLGTWEVAWKCLKPGVSMDCVSPWPASFEFQIHPNTMTNLQINHGWGYDLHCYGDISMISPIVGQCWRISPFGLVISPPFTPIFWLVEWNPHQCSFQLDLSCLVSPFIGRWEEEQRKPPYLRYKKMLKL